MSLTVLITGANRGLGLEFCKQYLNENCSVIACCREPRIASELNKLQQEHPQKLSVEKLDISDLQQHQDLLNRLSGTHINILINNAGVYGPKSLSLDELDAEEWQKVLLVNTIAPVLLTRNLQALFSPESKVAFVSSKMGSIGDNSSGGSYMYRTSKAALNAAVRSLAHDWADLPVYIALLHPGWVKTDMGGPNALITPEESIKGMKAVIDGIDQDDSGDFINYDGTPIPW